jgi:TetR/AcrR family transcriptional regulator
MSSDEIGSLDLIDRLEGIGETKKRIIKASISVFVEKGYMGGRIDEIARRADVNKAMIYYYFDSKEGLYRSIIEMVFENVYMILKENLGGVRPDTVQDGITSFIDKYIDFIYENRIFVKFLLWELARGGDVISDVINRAIGDQYRELVRVFQQVKDLGGARPMAPRHVMVSVIGMILFYFFASPVISTLWGEDTLSPENIRDRKREVTDFVIHAILPEKG